MNILKAFYRWRKARLLKASDEAGNQLRNYMIANRDDGMRVMMGGAEYDRLRKVASKAHARYCKFTMKERIAWVNKPLHERRNTPIV